MTLRQPRLLLLPQLRLPASEAAVTPLLVSAPAGLLRALGLQLARPEYWQTAYHLVKSPPFLTLLSLLVPRQPALHGDLLALLGRVLGALGNSNHDMAKGFLSVAVQASRRKREGRGGEQLLPKPLLLRLKCAETAAPAHSLAACALPLPPSRALPLPCPSPHAAARLRGPRV